MCSNRLSILLFLTVSLLSCETTEENNTNNHYDGNNYYYYGGGNGDSIPYKIVSDNPTSILSYSDLSSLPRGTKMKLRVNRRDFEIWEVDVSLDALYVSGRHRLILCHSPAGFPIGAGDSGSPVLTTDGKIAGILAYGYYGNSTDFAARVIEDILAVDTGTVSQYGSPPPSFEFIEPAYVGSGRELDVPARYAELSKRFGRNSNKVSERFPDESALQKVEDAAVIPGSSIAIVDLSGDYFDWIAVGTVSYVGENKYYAFGHPFYPYLAAPTYLATTGSFIVSNDVSFKMSQPTEQLVGAFTKDDYRGILIEKDVPPLVANLTTTCSANGQELFSYDHRMSNTLSFSSDRWWAMYISSYFVYRAELEIGKQDDSLRAVCTATVASEMETKTKSFTLHDRWVDWRIYSYCYDSLQVNEASKELKQFDLSVNLTY